MWSRDRLSRRAFLRLCGLGAALAACQEQATPAVVPSVASTTTPTAPAISPSVTPQPLPATGARPFRAPTPIAVPPGALNVRAFGALGDGVTDDGRAINATIQTAIAKGPGSAVFLPAGRYVLGTAVRASSQSIYTRAGPGINLSQLDFGGRTHVLVRGASGLAIVGEPGTLLLMKDPTASGIWLERCEDTTVSPLAIDYDPLPFTQGTIVDWDATNRTIDFRVDPGYLPPTEGFLGRALAEGGAGGGWVNVFSAAGHLKAVSPGVGDGDVNVYLGGITARPGGLFRVQGHGSPLRGISDGDRLARTARTNAGGHGVFLSLCRDCQIEFVTIHSAPVLAFVGRDCDGLIFRGCAIEVPAGTDRLYSANADGIHCKSNRRGPLIEACRFSRQGDDSFTVVQLAQALLDTPSENELVVELDQYALFRPGDRLAVIDQSTGLTRTEATVRDVTIVSYRGARARLISIDRAVSSLVSVESLGLSAVPTRPPDRTTSLNRRPDLVADLDLLGSGFVVRNNVFANHLAGARIHANAGVVENNRFENTVGEWLLIGMELIWPEVFDVRDLTIRNNTFTGTSNGDNVWIKSRLGNVQVSRGAGMGNQDIVIERNAFTGYSAKPAIRLSNAQRVRIRDNSFGVPKALGPSDPPQTEPPIALEICRDITVEGNTFVQGTQPSDTVVTSARTDTASVTVQNNRLVPGTVK